jgi:carboxymethylenebutenolidase
LCPDLVSAQGGTEALGGDEEVRAVLSRAPRDALLDDVRSALGELARLAPAEPLAVIGFCFGGTLTWALLDAGEPRLAAAVAFYGTAPDPADFRGSSAAVLGIYGGLDERVNESRSRAANALQAAGTIHRIETFEGADHAFFNDTGPRYQQAAAAAAWTLTCDWLEAHLGAPSP